jgi:hypothetical protein
LPLPPSVGLEKLPPAEEERKIVAPVTGLVPFVTRIFKTISPPGVIEVGLGTAATVKGGKGVTVIVVWADPLRKPLSLATT